MNVLEKILGEIGEKFKTADAEKFDCEELCDVEDWYDSGYIYGQLSAHKKCMDIIRSHMDEAKDINVPSNDGWIPVEKKLPEVPEENPIFDNKPLELYLVDIGAEYPIRAFWNGSDFTDGWTILKAIAWQPLPEPYKGGDDRA